MRWAVFYSSSLLLILLFNAPSLQGQKIAHEIPFAEHPFLPSYEFQKAKHPNYFQGNKKRKKYFEGWYFKMVSKDDSSALSIIPGISLSADGKKQHAFIQIIDGKTAETKYFSFPIDSFYFSANSFEVRIGPNYFSKDKIMLNLKTDSSNIIGEVRMSNQVMLPEKNALNAGIMGWYRFVPFMQCYHGVVSMHHNLIGNLKVEEKTYHFNGGRGYIEKDWGTSMPSSWIWMQSNSFGSGNTSFMLSVANIPWMGKSFIGFLGFFYHDGLIHTFATYTNAKLQILQANPHRAIIHIRDKKYHYEIESSSRAIGLLKAPVQGQMDRRIPESLDATITLTVRDKKGSVVYHGSSSIAGLEIVNSKELVEGLKLKK